MTGPISSSRASGASAVRLGSAGGKGSGVGGAMGGIAGNIAASIASELKLAVDPDGKNKQGGNAQDLYEVEEAASTIATNLGATPAERGQLSQALHKFAAEVASLMVAQPGSQSMTKVERALKLAVQGEGGASVTSVLRTIEQTTASVSSRTGTSLQAGTGQ
jgi:hypothetical protein